MAPRGSYLPLVVPWDHFPKPSSYRHSVAGATLSSGSSVTGGASVFSGVSAVSGTSVPSTGTTGTGGPTEIDAAQFSPELEVWFESDGKPLKW
jgi:hypothetical protein